MSQRPKRGALPPAQENIEKIEKVVNDGNSYGAQQMYKSITARYISAQRYSEALDILQSGACLQLKQNQITCGAELAALFVETLVKGKFLMMMNPLVNRVRKIYEFFPQIPVKHDLGLDDDVQELAEALGAAKIRVEGCSSFLKAAIRVNLSVVAEKQYATALHRQALDIDVWSVEFGAPKLGSPEIHVMLAEYLYSESPELDMARVSYHFVRGNNPKKFASTLVNFMSKCYPGEDDLAIARAMLAYLAMGNLKDANLLMEEIMKQVDSDQLEFCHSDLMQFISYLLQTLQRDAFPLFSMLRANYKPSIDREPTFNEILVQMLDEIAEKFYGIKRRNPLQGMFGELFKMM
ncbi:hypothetical protein JRO89_XS14G0044300 [Xanthoceras sorbifolium]|uniref:Golgi to ER traffic protein 4 homolog n=1 Tax=Xanthoceras sorbifolium TaxID=99658 RepID=A0ABQ8H3T3_9ROSI|nr:hypothetical protein JRO89_XS14G0044300 [Xanthoceras sorbifolium]